jgi:rhodanese-related sulfurtransferase
VAIREAVDRSGIEDGELQHSIFGVVVQAGVGQIPSRQANSHAGLPFSLTTETLNQVCASGLRSATLAETLIRAGDYDVVLAGGMESMSNAPYMLPKARWGARMGDAAMLDAMMHDGLLDAFEHVNMIRFGADGRRGSASPAKPRTNGLLEATNTPPPPRTKGDWPRRSWASRSPERRALPTSSTTSPSAATPPWRGSPPSGPWTRAAPSRRATRPA